MPASVEGPHGAGWQRPRGLRGRVALIATALLIGVSACGGRSPQSSPGRGATARQASSGGPTGGEKRAISAALTVSASACRKGAPASYRGQGRVGSAVATLVRFYRKYPTQAFQIPEAGAESAHMLSVVLVARSELRRCAPRAVTIIDKALPADVRSAVRKRR